MSEIEPSKRVCPFYRVSTYKKEGRIFYNCSSCGIDSDDEEYGKKWQEWNALPKCPDCGLWFNLKDCAPDYCSNEFHDKISA